MLHQTQAGKCNNFIQEVETPRRNAINSLIIEKSQSHVSPTTFSGKYYANIPFSLYFLSANELSKRVDLETSYRMQNQV